MRFNGFRLLIGGILLSLIFLGVGLFAANVKFNPEGVPKGKIAEYERIMARLAEADVENDKGKEASITVRSKVVVAEQEHDFGLLDPHLTVSHSFTVRNEGDADLVLTKGDTSCKCTVGDVGSPLVPPGKSTAVTLTWNTGYQSAHYTQSATIHTNDPESPSINLSVSGTVKAELAMTASQLIFPATDKAKLVESYTFLYSQLWDDFVIETVTSDLPGFQWAVEPVGIEELPSGDLDAKSAWKLRVMALPQKIGAYQGKINLVILPTQGGERIERELVAGGNVKNPIAFHDPEIHVDKGLDLGLFMSGTEHRRSIIVRVRNEVDRKIEVLSVKPDQLKAELVPTDQAGAHRLTLIIPADASPVVFNLQKSQGYVQVGDPKDKSFSAWMPVTGAVIRPANAR